MDIIGIKFAPRDQESSFKKVDAILFGCNTNSGVFRIYLSKGRKNNRGGRKKIRQDRIMHKGRKIFSATPKQISATQQNLILLLGQNRQEGGQKEKEVETSNNREQRQKTQLIICVFKCQHHFGTTFALIFCSDADYALLKNIKSFFSIFFFYKIGTKIMYI